MKNKITINEQCCFINKALKGLLFFCLISINFGYAQNPIVKIDFDQTGRNTSEVGEPDYTPWVVSGVNSANITQSGVTFTINRVGSYGNQLGTNWQKAAVQAPYYARLVGDGVVVKNMGADENGQIELRLSGLAAGNHTLLVFLNVVDSETYTYSPIDIFVDGNMVLDNVVPSVRALSTAAAKSVYLNLQATTGNDVVIRFAAETSGSYDFRNVMINGIELNTPNIFNQATDPIPSHNNEHVELNSGATLLKWTPAENAASHNIYFGTDLATVEAATNTSPEFKGNQLQANASYQVTGLYTGETYYWRVDEILGNSDVVKGNTWRFRPAILAFPEAEGYGRFARGGRGGKVVAVTNLNDSGPGSLREAVTNDIGPRTIVFNVSGLIQLSSRLVCSQPYVTIAGQTAPDKGITIRSAPLGITGNDNVVQNLRVRLGGGQTFDGMGLTGGDHSIIDHCSISWTIDESFSSRGAHNITLQRTLISEALNAAGHQNYPAGTEHGYAASIGGDIGSFHHNLLAHNYGRNWSLAGGLDGNNFFAGKLDITNNVIYNWGSRTTDGGANEVNFVGNYYKPGPGMQLARYAFTLDHEDNFGGMQRCYFNGNVMPGYFDESNQEFGRRSRVSNGITINYETFVDTPFFPSYVTTQSAVNAYKMVLSDVGCNQPVFDDHDQRMITETLGGTFTFRGSVTNKPGFPDNQADVGGYEDYPFITRASDWDSDNDGLPNWWETIIGTNINSTVGDFSDSNADNNSDGYTNLDYYLQWMAQPHYSTATGAKIDINIQQLSRGFTSGVSYIISDIVNGSTNLVGNIVEFTPATVGLCSFKFTVTDSAGDSMTRSVNILNGYNLTLSVEKKNQAEIKVWPIPNHGSFSVKMKNNSIKSEFKIFDILGKEVHKGTIEGGTEKNISLNSRGLYILQILEIETKQIIHIQKIIIQ